MLKLLNDSLATEIVCVLRYRRHHFMARGIHSQSVAQEFLDHSNEEQGHADQIAERIVQLGGAPDFAPDGLSSRSHAEYVEGDSLASMIREDLVAERIAIDSYRDFIQYLGDQDPTTRRMLEGNPFDGRGARRRLGRPACRISRRGTGPEEARREIEMSVRATGKRSRARQRRRPALQP